MPVLKQRAKGRSEQSLEVLSRRYGLPPMEYRKDLGPGCYRFSRAFGTIYLSESFRHANRAEILRVAFYGAGRYQARPFRYDGLPELLGLMTSILLIVSVVSPHARATWPTSIQLVLWLCGLFSAAYVLKIRPALVSRAANRWALEHWPSDLTEQGYPYTPVSDRCP